MYVNGVATAPVNEFEYTDGWFRTFKDIPKFTKWEKDLLKKYCQNEQFEEIIIYLERYREITGDFAEFILREFIRGNL